jgi:hypothetical protein
MGTWPEGLWWRSPKTALNLQNLPSSIVYMYQDSEVNNPD